MADCRPEECAAAGGRRRGFGAVRHHLRGRGGNRCVFPSSSKVCHSESGVKSGRAYDRFGRARLDTEIRVLKNKTHIAQQRAGRKCFRIRTPQHQSDSNSQVISDQENRWQCIDRVAYVAQKNRVFALGSLAPPLDRRITWARSSYEYFSFFFFFFGFFFSKFEGPHEYFFFSCVLFSCGQTVPLMIIFRSYFLFVSFCIFSG